MGYVNSLEGTLHKTVFNKPSFTSAVTASPEVLVMRSGVICNCDWSWKVVNGQGRSEWRVHQKKQCIFFCGENEVEGIFSPNFENYITKVYVGMKNDYIDSIVFYVLFVYCFNLEKGWMLNRCCDECWNRSQNPRLRSDACYSTVLGTLLCPNLAVPGFPCDWVTLRRDCFK